MQLLQLVKEIKGFTQRFYWVSNAFSLSMLNKSK